MSRCCFLTVAQAGLMSQCLGLLAAILILHSLCLGFGCEILVQGCLYDSREHERGRSRLHWLR
jgi:hypothetical protein